MRDGGTKVVDLIDVMMLLCGVVVLEWVGVR